MAKNKPKNLDKKYKQEVGKESLVQYYIENKVVYAKDMKGAIKEFRKLTTTEEKKEKAKKVIK